MPDVSCLWCVCVCVCVCAAFTLPEGAQWLKSCEMTMARRNVHACHAGALVHALEGWTHHEVCVCVCVCV